jgi:hypothetical protein
VEPANADDAHRPLEKSHNLAASLSHVETRQVRNDYTLQLEGEWYRIDPPSVVSRLRGASVRVEQRLDGTMAVRYGEKYLPVTHCTAGEKKKKTAVQAKATGKRGRPRRGSDWNKNFDLKKGPKIWEAAQGSGCRPEQGLDGPQIVESRGSGAKAKVRPIPGSSPRDRPGKPGVFLHLQRELATIPSPPLLSNNQLHTEAPQYAFSRQGGIYRSDVVQDQNRSQNQIPGREPTASRWSAPSPGKRARREDHALLIVRDEFRTGYSLIGLRSKELQRTRSELTERSMAHMYETGGMRRVHLKGRSNILKRLLVHAGGFNLALVMRKLVGVGKPRRLQGLSLQLLTLLARLFSWLWVASRSSWHKCNHFALQSACKSPTPPAVPGAYRVTHPRLAA